MTRLTIEAIIHLGQLVARSTAVVVALVSLVWLPWWACLPIGVVAGITAGVVWRLAVVLPADRAELGGAP